MIPAPLCGFLLSLCGVANVGCREAPLGLEMAVKLMVPGELALISLRGGSHSLAGCKDTSSCHLKYGYGTCDQDLPAGISPEDDLDFEVELLDFDKEAHWQVSTCACLPVGTCLRQIVCPWMQA